MSLVVDFTVTIDGVDVSQFVFAAGTIDYGRQGKDNSFTTPRAVFDMFLPEANPNPAPSIAYPSLEKWQSVVIHVTWDGSTQWRRFTGRIQALDYSRFFVTVTASGNTVDYAKHYYGGTSPFAPRSVEADIERAEWLATTAPHPLTIEGAAGRRLRQIERNTLPSPILDQLLRIADDCDGLLLEDRLGVPHFRSRNFTFPARYTLPHAIVDSSDLELSTDAGDAVTAVQVYYGEPSQETGLQASQTAANSALITALGYQVNVELDTDLRTPEGAAGRASEYLLRHDGGFYIPDIPLLMSAASGSEADDILDLQEGWPVKVETFPDGWPISELDCDVVGFTEIMHQTDYRIILHVEPSIDPDAEDDSDPIYPDGILTGYDATGTETIGGKDYRWCRWDAPGFVTNTYDAGDAVFVQLCAAAKGGDGGTYTGTFGHGGGGGAGGFINEHIDLNPGVWPVQVGLASNDGDTVFYGTRLYRGGDGGTNASVDGKDGGSGGGFYYERAFLTPAGAPGSGVLGQGYDGYFGGGGGAGDAPTASGQYGGDGIDVTIGGSTQRFVHGGGPDASASPYTPGPGSGGYGGSLVTTRTDGEPGVVYLRYRIG